MPNVVELLPAQLPPDLRRKLTADDRPVLPSAGLVNYEVHERFDGCLVQQDTALDTDPDNPLAPDASVRTIPSRAFPVNHPTPADIRRLTSLLP